LHVLQQFHQNSACTQRQREPELRIALHALKAWPLLAGFRGKAAGDVEALVDAVLAIAAYAQANAHRLLELDVNPVLVMPEGQGVLAVDTLIRLAGEAHG